MCFIKQAERKASYGNFFVQQRAKYTNCKVVICIYIRRISHMFFLRKSPFALCQSNRAVARETFNSTKNCSTSKNTKHLKTIIVRVTRKPLDINSRKTKPVRWIHFYFRGKRILRASFEILRGIRFCMSA